MVLNVKLNFNRFSPWTEINAWHGWASLAYFSRRVKFYSFEAYLCTDSRAASKNYGFWVKVQHSHMKPSTEHSSFAATLEIISKNFALQSFEQRILL